MAVAVGIPVRDCPSVVEVVPDGVVVGETWPVGSDHVGGGPQVPLGGYQRPRADPEAFSERPAALR